MATVVAAIRFMNSGPTNTLSSRRPTFLLGRREDAIASPGQAKNHVQSHMLPDLQTPAAAPPSE